jgi:hypothetical protein
VDDERCGDSGGVRAVARVVVGRADDLAAAGLGPQGLEWRGLRRLTRWAADEYGWRESDAEWTEDTEGHLQH